MQIKWQFYSHETTTIPQSPSSQGRQNEKKKKALDPDITINYLINSGLSSPHILLLEIKNPFFQLLSLLLVEKCIPDTIDIVRLSDLSLFIQLASQWQKQNLISVGHAKHVTIVTIYYAVGNVLKILYFLPCEVGMVSILQNGIEYLAQILTVKQCSQNFNITMSPVDKNSILYCLSLYGSVLLHPERHHRCRMLDLVISPMALSEPWVPVFTPWEIPSLIVQVDSVTCCNRVLGIAATRVTKDCLPSCQFALCCRHLAGCL